MSSLSNEEIIKKDIEIQKFICLYDTVLNMNYKIKSSLVLSFLNKLISKYKDSNNYLNIYLGLTYKLDINLNDKKKIKKMPLIIELYENYVNTKVSIKKNKYYKDEDDINMSYDKNMSIITEKLFLYYDLKTLKNLFGNHINYLLINIPNDKFKLYKSLSKKNKLFKNENLSLVMNNINLDIKEKINFLLGFLKFKKKNINDLYHNTTHIIKINEIYDLYNKYIELGLNINSNISKSYFGNDCDILKNILKSINDPDEYIELITKLIKLFIDNGYILKDTSYYSDIFKDKYKILFNIKSYLEKISEEKKVLKLSRNCILCKKNIKNEFINKLKYENNDEDTNPTKKANISINYKFKIFYECSHSMCIDCYDKSNECPCIKKSVSVITFHDKVVN